MTNKIPDDVLEKCAKAAYFSENKDATENQWNTFHPENKLSSIKACQAVIQEYLRSQWQPIETAPKDGTWVLVLGPSGYITYKNYMVVARYDDKFRPRSPWIMVTTECLRDQFPEDPTHWMPLPGSLEDGK